MCFSSPSIPPITPPPPVATQQDQAVTDALDRSRKARAMAAGRQSTILTGPQGVDMAQTSTAPKTLLGG
jgi:hypothetical protein